jgi:hypothetical protein
MFRQQSMKIFTSKFRKVYDIEFFVINKIFKWTNAFCTVAVIFPEQRCWQSDSIGREKQIGLLELEHSS